MQTSSDSPASHPALTECQEGSLPPRRWTDQMARHQRGLYLQTQTANITQTEASSKVEHLWMFKQSHKGLWGGGELIKTSNYSKRTTHLYPVVMWSVVVAGSHCWPVLAPAVSQGRREPCQKCLWTAVLRRYSLPGYEVMESLVKKRQTTKLFYFFLF